MSIIPNSELELLADKEESRFLKILLTDLDCLRDAISFGIIPRENGSPGHFLIDKNNFLYSVIRKNFLKYGTCLTRSAMESIMSTMQIGSDEDKASMVIYWDKIWNRHDAPVEDYAILREHINDRYILWQFYNIWKNGDQIVKSVSGHGNLVKQFVNDLNALKNIDPDPYSLTMGVEEGMNEAMKYIDDRRANPNNDQVIKCGIESIDRIFHGFARGSYTVISGMVNGGKTTLLMNFALNMAKQGYNVVYVSLEKDAKLFFRRTLACHALTDYNRIKTGGTDLKFGLSDYWYNKLKDAAVDLRDVIKPKYHCLQFIQNTKLTKILAEVDKLRAIHRKIDVLVVDYLQVIGVETNTVGRYDVDLANIHKRLMGYGRKHNIVTFTALQLKSSSSKEIRKKAEKVTTEAEFGSVSVNTEDYSGSQMIIADADNALGVVLNGDKPPTKMFVSFSKARDDESRKTICLDFDGKVGRICDPEYGEGQIKAVDNVLFDDKIKEEDLDSDANLFDEAEKQEAEKQEKKSSEQNATPSTEPSPEPLGEPAKESDEEDLADTLEDLKTDNKNGSPVAPEESPKEKPKRQKGQDIVEKVVEPSNDDEDFLKF